MIGQTISHYKITAKLGEGGMGVVYKAEDTKLERTVALKFLASHLLQDEEANKRFQREAKAAASVHHANVCPVYEIGEDDGQTFLAMAFIEGESLDKRIERGPLKILEALEIAQQIARGLEAAHEKGVIHRDIKPGNVIADQKGHVTVMDFGLALLTEGSKLTKFDTTLGTVAYMSPEQAEGAEVDQRSDIWALGCVLYEMVCGQRPFKGLYDQALVYEILNEEHEPMTGVRAGVPMELEVFVGKCLAKDREERYKDAGDLAVDLKSLQKKLESGRSTIASAPAALSRSVAGTQHGAHAQATGVPLDVGARHAVPGGSTDVRARGGPGEASSGRAKSEGLSEWRQLLLWLVVGGIVTTAIGLAMLLITVLQNPGFLVPALIVLATGLGLLVSAAIAYRFSNALGPAKDQ